LRFCLERFGRHTAMLNNFDEIINDCLVEFAARESEHNWSKRATLCARLSAQLEKTKPSVPKDFFDRIRILLDPFIEAALSERTNLSKNAVILLGNIAKAVGSLITPQLDYILPKLITICGSTKKISQTTANETITIICRTAGFSQRLLHHICSAFSDKSKFTRKFAPNWLLIIIQTYQYVLDPDNHYHLIDKAITSGLKDGEKDTRDATRPTYWAYAKLEKTTAVSIMKSLNPQAAIALRTDPSNPDKSSHLVRPTRPQSSLSDYKAKRKQEQKDRASESMSFKSETDIHIPPKLAKRLGGGGRSITSSEFDNEFESIFGQMDSVNEAPQSVSSKLISKAARRPRVVATPIGTQNPSTARPTSKGETSKKPFEHARRPTVDKKTGRATPNIHEDHEARLASSLSSNQSSLQWSHAPDDSWKTVPFTQRPTSSSSDPAGKQSPQRHAAQPKLTESLPIRHQKSSSASEPQQVPQASAPPRLELMSPVEDSIPVPTTQAMPPLHIIDGKENLDVGGNTKSSNQQDADPIAKARRTLAAITEAMRRGRLDALGYRKLKKLVRTNPGRLFTSADQFDEFYTMLIAQIASLDECRELGKTQWQIRVPKKRLSEQKVADFQSSAAYNRVSIIDTAIAMLEQYEQFEEPQPGMTFVALLQAYGNHPHEQAPGTDQTRRPNETIEHAVRTLLQNYLVLRNANAAMDRVLDGLIEIESVIRSSDLVLDTPSYMRPPATAQERSKMGIKAPTEYSHDIFSYRSEFGDDDDPPKLPDRLPEIMAMGLHILTTLIRHQSSMKWTLPDVQEERLGEFAAHVLKTYRFLMKREVMSFCSSLFGVIKDEQRFYSLFRGESDRNLVTYCISQSF
jgi:hypothetical protein